MSLTDRIIRNIPNWMAIANNTDSNGYKLLNSIGLELDEVDNFFDELESNLRMQTADVSIPDIIHKVNVSQLAYDTQNDITVKANIPIVDSVYKLLSSTVTTGMFNYDNDTFYINKYDGVSKIDVEIYTVKYNPDMTIMIGNDGFRVPDMLLTTCHDMPVIHHIWNCFDEFGLIVGLKRMYGENNTDFKQRIIDAISNPPGSNEGQLQAAIAREIGISPSDILFKTLNDVEIYDNSGNLSSVFMNYISMIKNIKPLSIAKWDTEIIDDKIYSIHYIPRIYNDALSSIDNIYIQSGIGDLDDLLITNPGAQESVQDYTTYVGLTANKMESNKFYPRHDFKVLVDATGIKMDKMHKPKDINFTVLAAENKEAVFNIQANQNYQLTIPQGFDNIGTVTNITDENGVPTSDMKPSKSDSVYIVPSNTIFHPLSPLIEVKIDLQSNDAHTAAPTISQMTIKYKRKDGTTPPAITVPLNDPEDNVKNDTSDTSGNTLLTIQKGEYYKVFQTHDEFNKQGVVTDNLVIDNISGIYLPISEV